jgi:outer membrane protein assembly factor BamB
MTQRFSPWSLMICLLLTAMLASTIPGLRRLGPGIGVPQALAAANGSVKWSFSAGYGFYNAPAVGTDGTIYVTSGTSDQALYAVEPSTGNQKWKFPAGGFLGPPAIGPDGTIYAGADDGYLYAVSPATHGQQWKLSIGNSVGAECAPAVGPDGTIYLGSDDGNLYAIRPTGSVKWKYPTTAIFWSPPVIGKDGTIYVGTDGGSVYPYDALYAINPDGSMKWENHKDFFGGWSSPAIGADGTIYVGTGADYGLGAFNPEDGSLKWKYPTGDQIRSHPAIGADGTIYAVSDDGYLYAIYPNGQLRWKYWTEGTGNDCSPAIARDGTIYVENMNNYSEGYVDAIDSTSGGFKWQTAVPIQMVSCVAIGKDGTVYAPNFNGGDTEPSLYAINSSSGPLANTPWPMFHHDLKRTGNARTGLRGLDAILQLLLLE